MLIRDGVQDAPDQGSLAIHIGRRQYGYCFHWARGIGEQLKALRLKTLVLYWAAADPGTNLEHNVIVVTARVAFNDDLDQLANTVRAAVDVVIAGATVDVVDAAAIRKPRKSGIAALRKVPGVATVLDEVVVVTPTTSRRASVKRITRAGVGA